MENENDTQSDDMVICPDCNGTGIIMDYAPIAICSTCNGSGYIDQALADD